MKRLFVFGNATVDLTMTVAAWPRPGETLLARGFGRGAGGKGLNQAVAAARAGARVLLAARIGKDDDGRYLRQAALAEAGIEAFFIQTDAPTDLSSIWVSADGENMIVTSAACCRSMQTEDATAFLGSARSGDILLLQGNLGERTTIGAAQRARACGLTVILNSAPIDWDMADLLPLVDILVCNAPEARTLSGLDGEAALPVLQKRVQGAVLLTLGGAGAVLAGDGGFTPIAAPKVEVVDTSGAGDMVVGMLAAALTQGLPLAEAARLAVSAASMVVTRAGTLASYPDATVLSRMMSTAAANAAHRHQ